MKKESKQPIDMHLYNTDQIVKTIESGVDESKLPWNRSIGSVARPKNIATGQLYRGINVVTLWVEAQIRGYSVPVFTFCYPCSRRN